MIFKASPELNFFCQDLNGSHFTVFKPGDDEVEGVTTDIDRGENRCRVHGWTRNKHSVASSHLVNARDEFVKE